MLRIVRNISNKCHLDIVSDVQDVNLKTLYDNFGISSVIYKQVILVRTYSWFLVGGLGPLGVGIHWYTNEEIYINSLGSDTCPVIDGRFQDYCNLALMFDIEQECLEKLRILRGNNEAT